MGRFVHDLLDSLVHERLLPTHPVDRVDGDPSRSVDLLTATAKKHGRQRTVLPHGWGQHQQVAGVVVKLVERLVRERRLVGQDRLLVDTDEFGVVDLACVCRGLQRGLVDCLEVALSFRALLRRLAVRARNPRLRPRTWPTFQREASGANMLKARPHRMHRVGLSAISSLPGSRA